MIAESLLQDVYRQAIGAAPAECCGFLDSATVFCCGNVWRPTRPAAQPAAGYCLSVADSVRLYEHVDLVGPQHVVIYHSHPEGNSNWSAMDENHARWRGRVILPDVRRLIVAVTAGKVIEARLYRFQDGRFRSVWSAMPILRMSPG